MRTIRTVVVSGLVSAASLLPLGLKAQDNPEKPASPPMTATGKVGEANISIHYGAPSVKGRVIWGKLVPYGEVWRAGANEATTFETDKEIKVEGQALPAGKYTFFTIPGEKEWTIIFNKVSKQWGAYDYSEKQDALRVKVKPVTAANSEERLVYNVTGNGVLLRWEKVQVPIGIK